MAHILKIGPVTLQTGVTNVYLRLTNGADVSAPVFAATDLEGVEQAAGMHPRDDLWCEPALEHAAHALGISISPAPFPALEARAAIAVFMVWGQRGIAGLGPEVAFLCLRAVAEFWHGKPWETFAEAEALRVTISGSLNRLYEGSVFGRDNHGYGLALYEEPGALQRLKMLQEAGHGREAALLPAIGLLLDDKPEYAVEALTQAGLTPRVPMPIRSGPEGPTAPSPEQVLALLAAARAVALISPESMDTRIEISVRDLSVAAEVGPPSGNADRQLH